MFVCMRTYPWHHSLHNIYYHHPEAFELKGFGICPALVWYAPFPYGLHLTCSFSCTCRRLSFCRLSFHKF